MTTAPPTDREDGRSDAAGPVSVRRLPGQRARRRRRRQREMLRQRAGLALAGVSAFVVVAVVAFALVGPLDGSDGDNEDAAGERGAAARVQPRTVLLVHRDAEGGASSVTLLASQREVPATVLLLPPGTMTEVPSYGLEAIGEAARLGGGPLLGATLENLLGVGIDDVVVVDDAALTDLVAPAGDLRVDVPQRVEEVDESGRVTVLWEAGENLVAPEEVPRLLSTRGEGSDLARLARHEAFWTAWLRELRRRPAARPDAPALRPLLDALADDSDIEVLPVETLDAGSETELYRVRQDAVDALLARLLPSAVPVARAGRIRVQILNGVGEIGLAQEATVRLVQPPTRARVLFTGNADRFDHEVTEVVFYEREDQDEAERVRRALGVGRLVLSRRPLGVVDVTVVVGRDFTGSAEAGTGSQRKGT